MSLDNKNTNTSQRTQTVPVNSVDFVSHVERLPTRGSNAKGIYQYGLDNNYPYKMKQIALRSNSLVTAINTNTRFLQGLGFEGATPADAIEGKSLKLNSNGLTAYDLLKFVCSEKSLINFAIHVNFNQLGEAVEFTPIPYEFCRQKLPTNDDTETKFIITNIWHTEFNTFGSGQASEIMNFNKWLVDKKTGRNFIALETFKYNPDPAIIRQQIEDSGGIENYSGQLYYVKDTTEVYQLANYDSVIDDAQTEAEAKLYSLSNLQNSFSASGIIKYPANLDSNEEFASVKNRLSDGKGASNAGRFLVMPYAPGAPPTTPFFENIQQNNVDKLFSLQKEEAKKNIYELFQQPEILNGRSSGGMFNQQSMQDAFTFYNAITEQARQEIEMHLTILFSNSIFANEIKLPIQIQPLTYQVDEPKTEDNENII
jgi:hypothetical protein